MKVRDLEIALVLAREMKAAAERSVDASLRLDQLQEVFGVGELDNAGRARIQTALQMAGLEPHPSLLEADPEEPIRFGANKVAVAAGASGSTAPPPPAAPPEEPQSFPTVGQFARSTLRTRRFGARRGDHGDEALPPPPVEPPATNGHIPEEAEIEPEPVAEHELVAEEPQREVEEHEPYEEPEEHESAEMPALEPLDYAEPHPEPQPAGARPEEVVAALLPAVAIPVLVTSVAGWRFGLPFLALTVIGTGWVLGRRSARFLDTLRHSAGARTALKVTGMVTLLSIAACVALVAARGSSTTANKAAAPAPPTASQTAVTKPAPKHKHHARRARKTHHAKRHAHKAIAAAPKPVTPVKPVTPPTPTTTPAAPPVDPATQGLVKR